MSNRCLPLLLLALLAVAGTARAQAPARTAASASASASASAPQLLEKRDCFGTFSSYDQWMDFLWEKNSLPAYLMIRLKFPEAQYDRYRRELTCHAITYRSDGHVVQGWLVQPRKAPRGKVPIVIYNRGGNRELGVVTFGHLFTHVFPLAERGYLVAASQYRGAMVEPEGTRSPDQFGGDDVRDVTNLMKLVIALPQADARNVFMIGQSRGSIMTFRAMLDPPAPIRAVAIYSGVYDLHDLLAFRPEFDGLFKELIPAYATQRRAELDRRSVTRWAARLPERTGVLLIHGGEDERAPVASARKFDGQLTALGRPHKTVVYPDESHFLDGHTAEIHAETVRWFRRFAVAPAVQPPAHAAAP